MWTPSSTNSDGEGRNHFGKPSIKMMVEIHHFDHVFVVILDFFVVGIVDACGD